MNKAIGTLYTNMACPYAHRAMLALELRPVPHLQHELICTTNQFNVIDRLGLKASDELGMLSMFSGKSAEELHAKKDAFKRINPSGEVPTLQLASGSIVRESEIVAEFLDATSDAAGQRLVPEHPLAAARVRIAMKAFNAVPPALVALLKNQDELCDESLTAAIDSAVAKFTLTIDDGKEPGAKFCFAGAAPTLADIHAAPFIFRFAIVLKHYRGFCLVTRHPRLGQVLRAMEALPQWRAVLDPADKAYPAVTEEGLIGLYAGYANNNLWANAEPGRLALAGRGVSRLPETSTETKRQRVG